LQSEKLDVHKRVIDNRLTIVFNPEEENAYFPIRCKCDPDSNEIDESEKHSAKHALHKKIIDDGITIVCNPE
jgi:hypothetical protein